MSDNTEAYARLDTFISEGRLIRRKWTGEDAEGRETACLLAALSPAAGEASSPSACPASLLPPWLAYLTPWVDDSGTVASWLGFVVRFAATIRIPRTEDQWFRAEYAVRALSVREAMRHTSDKRVLTAV